MLSAVSKEMMYHLQQGDNAERCVGRGIPCHHTGFIIVDTSQPQNCMGKTFRAQHGWTRVHIKPICHLEMGIKRDKAVIR